ncbi:hypothetical protein PQX77_015503 [Marasmius sp. AFHP31]|nr:hypothetical protein PQX77_015503 [Marasmius sp. AFHP31]
MGPDLPMTPATSSDLQPQQEEYTLTFNSTLWSPGKRKFAPADRSMVGENGSTLKRRKVSELDDEAVPSQMLRWGSPRTVQARLYERLRRTKKDKKNRERLLVQHASQNRSMKDRIKSLEAELSQSVAKTSRALDDAQQIQQVNKSLLNTNVLLHARLRKAKSKLAKTKPYPYPKRIGTEQTSIGSSDLAKQDVCSPPEQSRYASDVEMTSLKKTLQEAQKAHRKVSDERDQLEGKLAEREKELLDLRNVGNKQISPLPLQNQTLDIPLRFEAVWQRLKDFLGLETESVPPLPDASSVDQLPDFVFEACKQVAMMVGAKVSHDVRAARN